jgi:hypothetical protein
LGIKDKLTEQELQLLEMMMELWEKETAYNSIIRSDRSYFRAVVNWGVAWPSQVVPALLARLPKD